MEDKKYRISGEMSLAVPLADADRLLSTGDGTAALLYLYALRSGGDFSARSAAAALKRTESEIEKGMGLLCAMGIFSAEGTGKKALLPADELPEYTTDDIARRTGENGEFKALVEETQRILGHLLTGADLKLLFGIYDYLRLPAEVIFMLINHCVEETRERLGPGRLPSMRAIEKEAYVWYNREILTLERAEEHLRKRRERAGAENDVKRLLQISGRGFSASERKYVESWLDMGFDLEALALAYDKTVIKTGNLAWKYMDSILMSWHGKNLHTTDEILSGDTQGKSARPAGQALTPPANSGAKPRDDAELMRKLLSRTKNS